jgi:hypothetical protein
MAEFERGYMPLLQQENYNAENRKKGKLLVSSGSHSVEITSTSPAH